MTRRSGGGEGPTAPPLLEGRPHVWVIDVEDPAFLALADEGGPGEPLWSQRDRARAETFVDPAAGRRLLARRAATRIVLSWYVDRPPAEVRVVTAPGGKPVGLPGAARGMAPPAFSLGHSGARFCIGVARAASVGCDVERLRSVPRALAIAERWFGPAESAALARAGDRVERAFLDLWTCKEALAKRHGAGLRLMMGQSSIPEVRAELDVSAETEANKLRHFEPDEGYVGAVACATPIEGLEVLRPEAASWTT